MASSFVNLICDKEGKNSRVNLNEIIKQIGIPMVFNKQYKGWIDNAGGNKLITPQLFPAIYAIHSILTGATKSCFLN